VLLLAFFQVISCRRTPSLPPPVTNPAPVQLPRKAPPLPFVAEALDVKLDFVGVNSEEAGLFAVFGDGYEGRMDGAGNLKVPLKYHDVRPLQDIGGGFQVKRGFFGVLPESGAAGTYGRLDSEGREVIAPVYEHLGELSEGLIAFYKDQKAGFMDLHGQVRVPARFTFAMDFSEGLACVNVGGEVVRGESKGSMKAVKGGKWGFIDASGEFVIPPHFDDCDSFVHGRAVVRNQCTYSYWHCEPQNACVSEHWGLIDRAGRWIIQPEWFGIRPILEELEEGPPGPVRYYEVCERTHHQDGWHLHRRCGVMDLRGTWILPRKYEFIRLIAGYFRTYDPATEFSTHTLDGKPARNPEWEGLEPDQWLEKVLPSAAAAEKAEWGGTDNPDYSGTLCVSYFPVVAAQAGPAGSACEQVVRRSDGAWICKSATGREKKLSGIEHVEPFKGRFAPVRIGGLWDFMDATGELAVAATIEAERVFSGLCGHPLQQDGQGKELFFHRVAGTQGTLSEGGVLTPDVAPTNEIAQVAQRVTEEVDAVLDGPSSSDFLAFSERRCEEESEFDPGNSGKVYERIFAVKDPANRNLALLVKKKDAWGLLATDGSLLLPLEYQEIRHLGGALFAVCRGGLECSKPTIGWRVFHAEEGRVLPAAFSEVTALPDGYVAFRSLCSAKNACGDGKFGVLDRDGEVIYPEVVHADEVRTRWSARSLGDRQVPDQNDANTFRIIKAKFQIWNETRRKALPTHHDWVRGGFAGSFWVNQGCKWRLEAVDDEGNERDPACLGGKWGLFHVDRGMLIPFEFEALLDVTGPYAVVGAQCQLNGLRQKCRQQGVVDFMGNRVTPLADQSIGVQTQLDVCPVPFDRCRRPGAVDRGTILVSRGRSRVGLMDVQGRVLVPLEYDLVCTPEGNNIRVMKTGQGSVGDPKDAWGILDARGKPALPLAYGYISAWRRGVARVNEAGFCSAGYSFSCKGGRWGLLGSDRKFILRPKYDWISAFHKGRARAEIRPKYGLIRVSRRPGT